MKIAASSAFGVLLAMTSFAADPELISVKQGTHTCVPADSLRPSISDDGNVVAFESFARLTPDDHNKTKDIYVYDRRTKVLRRVHGSDPKNINEGAAVSGDGLVIAFHSIPPPPKKNVSPRTADIIWQKLEGGEPVVLTHGPDGTTHNGEALFPVLNQDGDRVLFTSNGTDLTLDSKTAVRNVYLLRRKKESIQLISKSRDGTPANRACGHPRMSSDGSTIAFLSAATNWEEGVPLESLCFHLYLHDMGRGTITQLDTPERQFDANEWIVGSFDMEASGNILVFEARRRDTDPFKSLETTDLFLYDRSTDTVKRITIGIFSDKSHNPSVSGDGRFVAFVLAPDKNKKGDKGGVIIHDLEQDRWKRVAEGNCDDPTFSKDGRVLAFELQEKTVKNIYVVTNPFKEAP